MAVCFMVILGYKAHPPFYGLFAFLGFETTIKQIFLIELRFSYNLINSLRGKSNKLQTFEVVYSIKDIAIPSSEGNDKVGLCTLKK